MKKSIFTVLAAVAALFFTGCNFNATKFVGNSWYKYNAGEAAGITQNYYFFFDNKKNIIRGGSEINEWDDSTLQYMKNTFSWKTIDDSAEKLNEKACLDLPCWVYENEYDEAMINVFYCDSEDGSSCNIKNSEYKYDKVTFTADGKGVFSNTSSFETQLFYWTVTDKNNFNESSQLSSNKFSTENSKVLKLSVKDKHYCFPFRQIYLSYNDSDCCLIADSPLCDFNELKLKASTLCTILD